MGRWSRSVLSRLSPLLWAGAVTVVVLRGLMDSVEDSTRPGTAVVLAIMAFAGTMCAADRRDKARLIRALAEASERNAPHLQRHLLQAGPEACQASSSSLPEGR